VVEARIVLAAWVLAVAGGAFAGGGAAYTLDRAAERQRAGREAVQAVLVAEAPARARASAHDPEASGYAFDDERVPVSVRWITKEGAVHTGTARAEPGTRIGTTVEVWTDGNGDHLVPEPIAPAEATMQAALMGVLVAVGGGAIVVGCGRTARGRVERRATERWGEEWDRFGPVWGRTTG
jgi:hypothetical protein